MHLRPTVLINLAQLGAEFTLEAVDSVVHLAFDKAWDIANDLEKRFL